MPLALAPFSESDALLIVGIQLLLIVSLKVKMYCLSKSIASKMLRNNSWRYWEEHLDRCWSLPCTQWILLIHVYWLANTVGSCVELVLLLTATDLLTTAGRLCKQACFDRCSYCTYALSFSLSHTYKHAYTCGNACVHTHLDTHTYRPKHAHGWLTSAEWNHLSIVCVNA